MAAYYFISVRVLFGGISLSRFNECHGLVSQLPRTIDNTACSPLVSGHCHFVSSRRWFNSRREECTVKLEHLSNIVSCAMCSAACRRFVSPKGCFGGGVDL